jgi:hypothetical protein
MDRVHDWRPLSELPAKLDDLRTSLCAEGELEDAIDNGLRSNLVPIRGRPFNRAHPDYDVRTARPTSAFRQLAGHIGPDTNIKIAGDFVSIQHGPLSGWYLRVEADIAAMRAWLRENVMPPTPRRTGRLPVVNWDKVKAEFIDLMEKNGDFMKSGDSKWCQARLEDKLLDFCRLELKQDEPKHSTIIAKFNEWLPEWRRSKQIKKQINTP